MITSRALALISLIPPSPFPQLMVVCPRDDSPGGTPPPYARAGTRVSEAHVVGVAPPARLVSAASGRTPRHANVRRRTRDNMNYVAHTSSAKPDRAEPVPPTDGGRPARPTTALAPLQKIQKLNRLSCNKVAPASDSVPDGYSGLWRGIPHKGLGSSG